MSYSNSLNNPTDSPVSSEKSTDHARQFHQRVLARNGGRWFSFEQYVTVLYKSVLRPGFVAVDGGANIGDHTLQMAAAVAPYGRVLAIEPVPEHLNRLTDRAVAAGIEPGIIEPVLCGLWSEPRQSEFHRVLHPDQHGLSGLKKRTVIANHSTETIQVHLLTLDDLCAGLCRFDFLKLDLEGAEWNALQGGRAAIQKYRPVVTLEQDQLSPSYFGYTWSALLDYFTALNYAVYDFFGICYETPAMFENCAVWDFIALPNEKPSGQSALKAIRRRMEQDGVVEKLASGAL
jgi:FkbM family methyltransferase